jgi:hypothetical protein
MSSTAVSFTTDLHLRFVNANPSILHCDVVDENQTARYCVRTATVNGVLLTTVTDSTGRTVALIDWQATPAVEIRGCLGRESISEWLPRSSDLR